MKKAVSSPRLRLLLLTGLAGLMGAVSACQSPAKSETPKTGDNGQTASPGDDQAVVIINGQTITRGQYEDALFERYADNHLETFIEQHLIETKAASMGVKADSAKVEAEVQKNVDTLLKTRFGGNEGAMRQALRERGMSLEGWKKELTAKANRDQLLDGLIKQGRNTDSDAVQKRFEQKYGEGGLKYRVRHVLVSTKVINTRFYPKSDYEAEKAKIEEELKTLGGEIARKLQGGEKFEALAKAHSDDYTANRGGDLGEAWKGRFGKAFDDAVLRLPVGTPSGLVRAKRGYHIIEVTGVNPGVEYRGAAILISNGPTGPGDNRSAEDRDKDALAKVKTVQGALSAGKTFAEVAKANSDDMATKARGGELGVFGRRRLGKEVDVALEKSPVGKVTDPIKSPRGYWLVKLDARKPMPEKDRRVVRHIFLSAEYDDVKKRRLEGKLEGMAKAKAEELIGKLEGGADFKELAIEHTEDAYTRKAGGEYYNYRRTSLGPEVWDEVQKMAAGKDRKLIKSNRGFHIVEVIERTETKFDDVKGELLGDLNDQLVSPADSRKFLETLKTDAKVERKIGPPPLPTPPKGHGDPKKAPEAPKADPKKSPVSPDAPK